MDVSRTVDHLFRHEYGSLVAGLASRFGRSHIEWIEDAVQEALYKAMKLWGFEKIPEKPGAWLYKVAHNALVDRLRKEQKLHNFVGTEYPESENTMELRDPRAIQDEQLQMIFACCHPTLSEKDSLLLSLKLIGGFSVREIARALIIKEEAAKKSVQRARSNFKEKVGEVHIPEGREMATYLDRVLKVIYLIFNEGYKASDGDKLVKDDLCGEALRLALLLEQKDHCQTSELHALISLFSFKAARFEARQDREGELLRLEDQDRSRYQPEFVQWGFYYFNQATRFRELSPYYLEAAIEYQYHIATSFSAINWGKLLAVHEKIQEKWPSARGMLNLLIVKAKLSEAGVVLKELAELEQRLSKDHLFHAFKAELLEETGHTYEAQASLQQALVHVKNEVEKKHLQKTLSRFSTAMPGPVQN